MAIFPANEATQQVDVGYISSSDDVDVDKWLASRRDYNGVVLRPVFVLNSPTDSNVAHPEMFGKGTVASFPKALYEVEITTDEFDQHALCDALLAAMALQEEPFDGQLVFIPIPNDGIPEDRTISTATATAWYDNSFDEVPELPLAETLFSMRSGFTYQFDDTLWMFATTIADDEEFIYASIFLREALRDYMFIGGEVKEVLRDTSTRPSSIAMAARIENAVHNCYKAVEAVSGGNLPQKTSKVVRKFKKLGVDLETEVGYKSEFVEREPAIDKLERLRHSRDWKAAHGRIHANRKSTFYELMDFQQLTRFILFEAMRQRAQVPVMAVVAD